MSLNKIVISLGHNWIFSSFLLCEFLSNFQKQIHIFFFYKEIAQPSQTLRLLPLKNKFNLCHLLSLQVSCHVNYYIFMYLFLCVLIYYMFLTNSWYILCLLMVAYFFFVSYDYPKHLVNICLEIQNFYFEQIKRIETRVSVCVYVRSKVQYTHKKPLKSQSYYVRSYFCPVQCSLLSQTAKRQK